MYCTCICSYGQWRQRTAMIKQSDETYETVPISPGFGERKPGHPFIVVTKLVFGQLKHRRQTLRQTSSMEVQGIRRWTKLSTSVMVSWLTLSTTLTNHPAAQFNNQHRYVWSFWTIFNYSTQVYEQNAFKRHCFHRLRLEVLLLVPPQTSWIVTKPNWRSATITGEIDPQRPCNPSSKTILGKKETTHLHENRQVYLFLDRKTIHKLDDFPLPCLITTGQSYLDQLLSA